MAGAFTRSLTSSARELGRLIGDPELPLPGENPGTEDPREAGHWAAVHAELLEMRLELLQQLRRLTGQVSNPSVAEGLRQNAQGLELAVNRSGRRVAYWARRLEELATASRG